MKERRIAPDRSGREHRVRVETAGHADASITLKVHTHVFDAAEHARRASDRLEAGFAKVLPSGAAVQPVADGAAQAVNVAPFPVPAMGGTSRYSQASFRTRGPRFDPTCAHHGAAVDCSR
jgi:hypothetical protein